MLTGRRASNFIRRFGGPGDDSGIVCFRFWQLVPAGGCPYRCAYCFLQTTPWFRFKPDQLYGLVYTNVDDMLRELDKWLDDPIPKMLIVGELQDGLVFEKAFKKVTGKPLTHWIVPKFAAQTRHRLIFLTKSTQIQHALELEPTPQAVFSWSVNAQEVAARWEHGTPAPSERFAACSPRGEGMKDVECSSWTLPAPPSSRTWILGFDDKTEVRESATLPETRSEWSWRGPAPCKGAPRHDHMSGRPCTTIADCAGGPSGQVWSIMPRFAPETPGERMSAAMSVRDVAEYLNVDEKTVYRLVKRGELPGFKVSGVWRFKREDIDAWIEDQKRAERDAPEEAE